MNSTEYTVSFNKSAHLTKFDTVYGNWNILHRYTCAQVSVAIQTYVICSNSQFKKKYKNQQDLKCVHIVRSIVANRFAVFPSKNYFHIFQWRQITISIILLKFKRHSDILAFCRLIDVKTCSVLQCIHGVLLGLFVGSLTSFVYINIQVYDKIFTVVVGYVL